MARKVWYEVYGDGQTEKDILLVKVKSKGLAHIIANALAAANYKNVTIK